MLSVLSYKHCLFLLSLQNVELLILSGTCQLVKFIPSLKEFTSNLLTSFHQYIYLPPQKDEFRFTSKNFENKKSSDNQISQTSKEIDIALLCSFF